MEEATKIVLVKNMTKEKDDSVITAYLEMAKESILSRLYPYSSSEDERVWLSMYDTTHVKLAAYYLNKRGAEMETAHSEGGVSRSYGSADIPAELLREITPFVKII